MNFKKRVNSSWVDTPHYIHKTDTDTITTLPAIIHSTGSTATVGLKGNTVQSGTPTPDNPIMPQGCGNMTANFFNQNDFKLVKVTTTNETRHGTIMGVLPQGTYTFNATKSVNAPTIYLTKNTNGSYSYESIEAVPFTFTADGTSEYMIRISQLGTIASWAVVGYTDMIVNTGSTALPYEPYGIKIPISSANTTTNVYLGEVQTTRKVKKLVLTGEEDWNKHLSTYYIPVSDYYRMYDIGSHLSVCSHFENRQELVVPDGYYGLGGLIDKDINTKWNGNIVFNPKPLITTKQDWMNYLAAQYAAGTPVTVWYVLETPETAVVNEPIRKIGDYADEVSGISIPTIAGANTIDIDTTLKPSEVTVNYHGWHPVADVHERESGAWT